MTYLAHVAQNGRTQTVEEHLEGTGRRSAAFAADFGGEDHGKLVGLAHDIGKTTKEFQNRLCGGHKVDHATAGAMECTKLQQLFAACCVIGHHSGLPDFGNIQVDQPGTPTFVGRLKKGFAGGVPAYQWIGQLPMPGDMPKFHDEYTLSLWVRMLYSCLVDADFLDTEEFMTEGTVRRDGYDTLPSLLEKLKCHIAPWFPPQNELNRCRCEILSTCLEAGAAPKGMYTLTVPTGGGKTVASLAFALQHAVKHQMKRIIYVIPYTSIIEQNAAVFREILGEEHVIEHHSGASFDSDAEMNGAESLQRLAAENWDGPVVVTTAVQFFESLYSNRPSKCRKLHNIANSVIVFDEVQMLPTVHLKPCVGVISNLVAHFNATAILCTATQPVLKDLIQSFCPGMEVKEICSAMPNMHDKFRRVTFCNGGKLSHAELAEKLSLQSQVLCIVNTRKAAQEIYMLLPEEGKFHLSTLMYPAHRQATIMAIRQRLTDGFPCRVVSTSLIEAGVDIDFPAVYRELAGLDSILQAAGRCNREGRRSAESSIVTYFEGETPPPLLFRTGIGATREALFGGKDPGDLESIERYFSAYRSLMGDHLDKACVVEHLRNGIGGCSLPFETVAGDFHLIDQTTKTIYIPLEEGKQLCSILQNGGGTMAIYRKAGRYGVNVYDQHYRALMEAGDIRPLDEDSAVLISTDLYDQKKGLSLQADTGKAEFV